MPIDPITGIATGIVGAAANAQKNKRSDEKLKTIMQEHSDTVLHASNNLFAEARRRNGEGTPLGWLYSGVPGHGVKCYFNKEEYLYAITRPNTGFRPMWDISLAGWNPEWGDCKTECAKARRAYYAQQNPAKAKEILASPLESYHFNLQHWETEAERWEREKHEQQAKRDAENKGCLIMLLINLIGWPLLLLLASAG